MPAYRTLARNHDFRALWIGQTVSEVGSRMSMFVFPLLAYLLTGSALVAAAAEALHLLGLAGALLPAGVLADRVDRRRIMRAASGAGVCLYSSLAIAGALGALTVPHLMVVALLTGVGAGVFMPAEIAALPLVVTREELPTALSQNQARLHVAALVSAPLGGLLLGVLRWLPFAVDAVTFAFSWVLLGRLHTDLSPTSASSGRRRPWAELAEGVRFVWSRPFFRVLMMWSALTNLAVNALFFLAVLRLVGSGTDAVHIGLVEAVAGAAGITGAVLAPWLVERLATGHLTVAIAWSFVPLVVPMALWNEPLVVAAALGTGMLLNPAGNAGIASYRIAVTPPELVGRVQSTSQFVSMSAMPLAPLLAGVMLEAWGGSAAILALGAFIVVVACLPTFSRSVRAVPRPAAWERFVAPGAVASPAA
ncbi:MFS transporter [Nocardioides sp. Arc9.136]|uniref:MFS transporter n=1 Tax=Nocardioides sp. Arc9.136 TaxID=2996826 RepID=UPI0026671343|nr:MFS transporter [Nocardioides sp. Arc9.136]WKN46602.1 MFS transporter [Nocardioides sp. Arc9.136]